MPTEKHELESKLSIIWYRVQDVNPQWSLTVYYSSYAQIHIVIKMEVSHYYWAED